MPYIPNTDADRKKMLERIGVTCFDELISEIPVPLRMDRPLEIPAASEMEVMAALSQLAESNRHLPACFAGAGVYDHYIPAAVDSIISRPEFMTAYTPYQAEVAQGTLQVIYEFQTHICRLTGMDVANASMYDGATATAEAAIIATLKTKRSRVLICESVNPIYREVVATYLAAREVQLVTVPMVGGVTDPGTIDKQIDDQTACVILGQPNFFGMPEDVEEICKKTHLAGALMVVAIDPIAQLLLKTPGECDVDIVVGEGQPMGVPLSYGGPLLGFFAARKSLIRSLPGRIAARTRDIDDRSGFVLTLQTREQHIRRDKATSNICTNQALCATACAVHLSLLGKSGMKQVALLSAEKAQKTAAALFELEGYEPYFAGPFVREFAVRTPRPAREIILRLVESGVLAGVDAGRWYSGMDNCLIVALTEKRTTEEINKLVRGCKELAVGGVMSSLQK